MLVRELQYDLPDELIAQRPAEPRDSSRLLVVDRRSGELRHRVFREVGEELRPGDCLVVNDTRVVPARFFARRATGGRVECFFLRAERDSWRVLLNPSSRLKVGERLALERDSAIEVELTQRFPRGEWAVTPTQGADWIAVLNDIGEVPLPPYIRREAAPDERDRERYQTIFAAAPGAVAAPTAGLHFTSDLLERVQRLGVGITHVTLHVGLGTFAPVDVDDLDHHPMHTEWYHVDPDSLRRLRATRACGGRIIPVGTTSCRVLESIDLSAVGPVSDWTRLLIQPGHEFRNVDSMITNFHLPGSTLIALVMALGGRQAIRSAYECAIANRYRFFSYGDAMMIV